MRDGSNTVSLMTDIQRRVEVAVVRKATAPTTERLLMSLSPLDMTTTGAGCAGVGWSYHGDSKAGERRKQQHAVTKEARGMFLPANQPFGIFQGNASSRALRHGHSLSSLTGNDLSRWTHRTVAVPPLFRMILFPLVVTIEHGAQVRPFIPVRPGNRGSRADITAKPALRLLDLGQGNTHGHARIPLPILAKDFRALIQFCAWEGEGAVDSDMALGWNIEAAVATPRHRRTAQHDPAVKAGSFPRLLNFGAVYQFGLQKAGLVSCLSRAPVVDIGAPVGSADELAHAFCAGKAWLLHTRKLSCDICVRARKQSSQRHKRVGLIHSRVEFELVRQVHRCHMQSLANSPKKATPPQGGEISGNIRKYSGSFYKREETRNRKLVFHKI